MSIRSITKMLLLAINLHNIEAGRILFPENRADLSRQCAFRNKLYPTEVDGIGIGIYGPRTQKEIIDYCKNKLQLVAEGKLCPSHDASLSEEHYKSEYRIWPRENVMRRTFISIDSMTPRLIVVPVSVDGQFCLSAIITHEGLTRFATITSTHVNSLEESIRSFPPLHDEIKAAAEQCNPFFKRPSH